MRLNKNIKTFFFLIGILTSCQTRNDNDCKHVVSKYVPADFEMFGYFFGKSKNEISDLFLNKNILPNPKSYLSDRASALHCKHYSDTSFFFSTTRYVEKEFYLNVFLMDDFFAFKRLFLAHVHLYYNAIYQNLNNNEKQCIDKHKVLYALLQDVSYQWDYGNNVHVAQYIKDDILNIENIDNHEKVLLMIFFMLDGLEYTVMKYSKQEQTRTGLPEDLFYMKYFKGEMNCGSNKYNR
jgi:hypothetical protein